MELNVQSENGQITTKQVSIQKRKPDNSLKLPLVYGAGEATVNWEWFAHRIKERYKGLHFNFEMLLGFVKKEKLTRSVHYYSSEEMKANPKLNETDDVKAFLQTAIQNVVTDDEQKRKANPFLTLIQIFYNAEEVNFHLHLHNEDLKYFNSKIPNHRSGIFFQILAGSENN